MSDNKIIDGKAFAAGVRARVAARVAELAGSDGIVPGLAVVLVGDDPASHVYVRNKRKQTLEVGMHSDEVRLGADARTDGHHAVVRGVERLSSAPAWASDIRAGVGLVLAGLCADGVTEVWDVFHIDRGYPGLVDNLVKLGADVRRVTGDPDRA